MLLRINVAFVIIEGGLLNGRRGSVAILMLFIFVTLVVCVALVLGYGLSLFEGWPCWYPPSSPRWWSPKPLARTGGWYSMRGP